MVIPESEKEQKKKRLTVVTLILVTLLTIAVGVLLRALKTDPGWREIEVRPGSETTAASQFHFWYQKQSGLGGKDFQTVTQAYTDASVRAYAIFDVYGEHEGTNGIYQVNASPNTAVRVEHELYEAFALMEERGGRLLYLAPVCSVYDGAFFAEDDSIARRYDPRRSEEAAEYIAELIAFSNDPAHVSLELLGDDTVMLHLSDEYRAYAAENEITVFVDFYRLTNAFIMDMLEEAITATGYTRGYIFSDDGCGCCLDDSGEEYAITITDRSGEAVKAVGQLKYTGRLRSAALHSYTNEETYADYFYRYEDGTYITAYIDPADGLCRCAYDDLLVYSRERSCAELALAASAMMTADTAEPGLAEDLAAEGAYAVYCEEDRIMCWGSEEIYAEGTGYQIVRMGRQ